MTPGIAHYFALRENEVEELFITFQSPLEMQ
jgi:hypothetical protein